MAVRLGLVLDTYWPAFPLADERVQQVNNLKNCFCIGCRRWRAVWTVALISVILTLLQLVAFAAPPTPAQVAQARQDLQIYYSWINAPWTDNDQPYQRIRLNIDQAISQGANPFVLVKQRQKELEKAPQDFQAQFAYYHTAYQAVTWPKRADDRGFDVLLLGNLSTAIIRAPHPHTYNYVRLEFLCGQYNFNNPKLKAVGLRLVHRDPNDYDVKYYTNNILVVSPSPADHAIALKYANDLVKNYPKMASPHAMAGYIHYQSWLRTKNKQEADEAVSQYQQYLRLAPAKARFRQQAENLIKQMQTG